MGLAFFILAYSNTASAHDYCGQAGFYQTQGEAVAAGQTYLDNMHWSYANKHCSALNDRTFPWNGYAGAISCHGDGALQVCYFWVDACEDQGLVTNPDTFECEEPPRECEQGKSAGQQMWHTLEPGLVCDGECMMQATTGSCTQDSQGVLLCMLNMEETGAQCEIADTPNDPPDNCTVDSETGNMTCDCTFDDSPWCEANTQDPPINCISSGGIIICPEGSGYTPPPDSNDSGGSDGSNNGGNSGGSDGNPNTPDVPGTGDGDTDGDGGRDVDCDPNSNPDCGWASSASYSSICGSPPACSGDPVQCAQLFQEYNTMCATITGANKISGQLGQINQALSKTQSWSEPTDIEDAKTEAQEKEGKIKDPNSEFWTMTDEESGTFITERQDEMAGIIASVIAPFANTACPVFPFAFASTSYDIDPNKFAPYIRAALTFFIWYQIATNGLFLFFRVAF